MKKILFFVAALLMVACSSSDKPADKNTPSSPKATSSAKTNEAEGRIAYVELDSVNSQYKFCVDQNEALEKEQQGYANTLQQKATAIQNGMADLQKKMQSGQITSEAQYNQIAQGLQAQQKQYEQLEQQYTEAIAKRTADLQSALQDSINNYIKIFNADGRFSLILGKQSVSILYAAPGYDITAEFVEGLNKRYKK